MLKLRGRSGSMGMGVGMNGILSLGACHSGLQLGIWRIFGPFQRSILIPWRDIQATPSRAVFAPAVQLTFGVPEIGRLKIDARAWQRLRDTAAEGHASSLPSGTPRVSGESIAKAMLLQWALGTLFVGSFFCVVSRLQGQPGIPIIVCFAFPAVMFGFGTAIRLLRQI